jgi:hypothetical protein
MKYMGSKRVMLQNGLGEVLRSQAAGASRVVDLFCGSASVSWFAACEMGKRVLAVDLQAYAAVLAEAVVGRVYPLDPGDLRIGWLKAAQRLRLRRRNWKAAHKLDSAGCSTATWVGRARTLCSGVGDRGFVFSAYGGHYFSPTQAMTLDCMLSCLPATAPERTVCLAATIIAASQCAAAPGHTAQPFQPTRTAGRFLREAWGRDPLRYASRALTAVCPLHGKIAGEAIIGDAVGVASRLNGSDLVFVDPPYSGVHYSRFYHVLESIARGRCGRVFGTGRYSAPSERPASAFSRKTESLRAVENLLERLAGVGSTVIFTFPAGECSNGLSGSKVIKTARQWFSIDKKMLTSRFSTLGGKNDGRGARHASRELILVMQPVNRASHRSGLPLNDGGRSRAGRRK